jgi:uncharacterized protein YndB with AHSA1/START domain
MADVKSEGSEENGVSEDSVEDEYGRLERGVRRVVLHFRRRLAHGPHEVWRAITGAEHLAAWFPSTIEGERKAGAPLHFGFRNEEAGPFDGEMLTFDPPRLMELLWGDETLRFELQSDGEGTLLAFSAGFEEIGKASRDGAGWHSSLDLLRYAIDGEEPPWPAADRWRQLRDSYIVRFGPEASTVGPPREWEEVHGAATDRRD